MSSRDPLVRAPAVERGTATVTIHVRGRQAIPQRSS